MKNKFINSLPDRIGAALDCNAEPLDLLELYELFHHVRTASSLMYFSPVEFENACKPLLYMAYKDRVTGEDFFMQLQEHFPWALNIFSEAYYREYLVLDEERTEKEKHTLFRCAVQENNVEFFPLLKEVNKQLKTMLEEK